MNIDRLLKLSEKHEDLRYELGDLKHIAWIFWEKLSPEAQAEARAEVIEFLSERLGESEETLLQEVTNNFQDPS